MISLEKIGGGVVMVITENMFRQAQVTNPPAPIFPGG
jgi:hypothetical protein